MGRKQDRKLDIKSEMYLVDTLACFSQGRTPVMTRKVDWLVYLDTSDDPIRVEATTKENAKSAVQEMLYEDGMGKLNVGCVGLVDIVQEVRGNEYWEPTKFLTGLKGGLGRAAKPTATKFLRGS